MREFNSRIKRLITAAAIVCCVCAEVRVVGGADEGEVSYVRDIKPLFARHCSACHGALKQNAGLRLDAARLILKGSDDGTVVVPGKADESLLIGAVTGNAGFRMPPEGEGSPLNDEQVRLIKDWINQGAKGPADEEIVEDPRKHWSYTSPQRPPLPSAYNNDWASIPIDAFVSAEHKRRGLTPRPAAPKHVLLRRVYLDLIGLPPSRDELHEFLSDELPDAYEKVVDRLLASPQYGERWGRHWMDVWRYSDWYGRRGQNEIRYSQYHIWHWRDWIIKSLNDDKGYDRMIVEMLAGDEVAPSDREVLSATGYLGRNWYKFDRNVWLHQTVEHTAMGFLGLTLKCARCHDHKYDPITQKDYYQFRAYFEPHAFRIDPVAGQPDTKKDGIARVFDEKLEAPTFRFIRGDDRNPDKDHPLRPGVPASLGIAPPEIQSVSLPLEAYSAINELTAQADKQVRDAATKVAQTKAQLKQNQTQLDEFAAANGKEQKPLSAFLKDDFAKPRQDTWKIASGNWKYQDGSLRETQVAKFATIHTIAKHPENFRATVRYKTTAGGKYRSVGLFFDMVGTQHAQAVYTSANDNRPTVQAFHRENGREVYPPNGVTPCDVKVGQQIELQIEVRGQQLKILVDGESKLDYQMPMARRAGQFALWVHNGTAEFFDVLVEPLVVSKADLVRRVTHSKAEVALAELQLHVQEAERSALLARIAAERESHGDAAQFKMLSGVAARAERKAAIAKAELAVKQAEAELTRAGNDAAQKKLAQANDALAKAESAAENPGDSYQALPARYPTTSTGRRTALARWMVNPQNPRTARVAINHIWLRHFGAALVPSVANFGLAGKPPSHPELLDWLAVELIDQGWSMKEIHRQIVLSNTYRMSSSVGWVFNPSASAGDASTADLRGRVENPSYRIDPTNRFLWRMNWRRMEAEVVRDSLLHVAGNLDMAMGGAELAETEGQTSRRRSLYFRTTPDNKMALLELFDLANPNECYEREQSVVPQQALALANSAIAQTQSRALARKLAAELAEGNQPLSDEAFVIASFQQALSRSPTDAETSRCATFLQEQRKILAEKSSLTTFSAGGQRAGAPAADIEMRARENLVHVLINHNEFVTVR